MSGGDSASSTLTMLRKNRTTLFFPRLLHIQSQGMLVDAIVRLLIIITVLAVSKMDQVLNYPGMPPRRLQSVSFFSTNIVSTWPCTHLLRCVHTQNRRFSRADQYIVLQWENNVICDTSR